MAYRFKQYYFIHYFPALKYIKKIEMIGTSRKLDLVCNCFNECLKVPLKIYRSIMRRAPRRSLSNRYTIIRIIGASVSGIRTLPLSLSFSLVRSHLLPQLAWCNRAGGVSIALPPPVIVVFNFHFILFGISGGVRSTYYGYLIHNSLPCVRARVWVFWQSAVWRGGEYQNKKTSAAPHYWMNRVNHELLSPQWRSGR